MEAEIKYGLVVDGKLLHFNESDNGADAEYCNQTSVELTQSESYPVWLVNRIDTAFVACQCSEDWYNSCIEKPQNGFVGRCKVVRVHLTFEVL